MLLVSEPEWMKKASSSEGATELLTQTPSVTPAAFPTDSLTEGPTQTPSVTPAAFPTPSSSEGPTQMPTQTTSVTPAAFPTTSLPECPTQTTSVTPAAFQLTSLSEGQTQITSDTTAASHTTCLPESQTQLPPQIPSVTPAAFPTTSLPECPTQTTSVTPAAFQLTVLSEGQTQITSDTTAASHTTSLPESQTQLPPQIHSVTTAAFPTACLSKGQTQTPSLTPAAFSTATAQPMTHPEFTAFPFSGTSIAATPTMLRDALDIINDDMPRTPTNSNTRQLIDGDQPFADMFPSPSAADRRLSLAWDRKLDALNKRMSLMSRQLGEVTRMLTYIIHQQGSNRVIAEPAEPPFFTTPAVETPGISTHDNRLAAEPPLPHVQPDSRSCIDEFSDIPVHCRIPTEKLLQMKTAATSIGNFACFLTVRLFPELFTAENARFRYNFNGHRANKEPLDHMRKQYLQRYLLFFYPHLSDPKIYHENVVDPVNEYLRRKNLKMIIIVKPSGPPVIPMGTEEIDKLKVCMSNRYDVATKGLNLSSLHQDQELQQQDLYMALARDQVMSNVVKIISENIPELVCLDMSANKLFKLDMLKELASKTPDLNLLNLSNNKLTHVEELRKISNWKLNTLHLDGNPLCDKFSDQTSYISAVRKIFPKVLKLDGHDLPAPITFDIEARTDLPKSKDSSFPDTVTQSHVVKFLKDYFTVYDSDNRNVLDGAYHPSAVFSLSTSYNGAVKFKQPSLSAYIEESRNLLRVNNKDTGRKQKLLKYGNLIVPQICLLPKTQHDPNSFIVDVAYTSPQCISFTVQGVFREVTDSKQDKGPIRSFSRTFTTVPGGSGMLIVNDMLTVTNASPDQIQSAFKTPAPTPSSSPVPEASPRNPFEGAGLTQVQQQMVTSFMSESGMNAEFSKKCLAENNWEYEKAGQIFLDLNSKKMIPPEAFMK